MKKKVEVVEVEKVFCDICEKEVVKGGRCDLCGKDLCIDHIIEVYTQKPSEYGIHHKILTVDERCLGVILLLKKKEEK